MLLAGGAAMGVAAPPASARQAADEPSEGDLATIRLLASGELLAQAFYTRALASKRLSKAEAADLAHALDHERDHYTALKQTLGDTAPLADDFEFAFPKDAFTRRGRMLRLGTAIETPLAGTYASAAATASTVEVRALLAQVEDRLHVARIRLRIDDHELVGREDARLAAQSVGVERPRVRRVRRGEHVRRRSLPDLLRERVRRGERVLLAGVDLREDVGQRRGSVDRDSG